MSNLTFEANCLILILIVKSEVQEPFLQYLTEGILYKIPQPGAYPTQPTKFL
jgi:hypothetical protein